MVSEVVAEHSVCISLLPEKANILDIGCRGFLFANFFLGHNVFCIDMDKIEGNYHQLAISDSDGLCGIAKNNDPQSTHVIDGFNVRKMTLNSFSEMVGIKNWDLIKMDIEGHEMLVLKSLKHPYAKQISVEFHAHCGIKKEAIDSLLDYLSEWYEIHNRVWEKRHGCDFNYWDILLIAK